MTCIVGITDGKNVWIGGDSAGVEGVNLTMHADEKVFRRIGEPNIVWIFGFTTSFRMGQLIHYDLCLPKIEEDDRLDLHRFMVKKFIPALKDCLSAGGWQAKKDEREQGGQFIVGILGELFSIEDDYQVGKPARQYHAVGSGASVALGALYASKRSKQNAKRRILIALEAAEAFNTGVRGPFKILEIGTERSVS